MDIKTYNANINIFLKPTVNDPQGITVKSALQSLGFFLENVRVGKFIEISLEANSREHAYEIAIDMCEKLLANTIIEKYTVNIDE